ncbi:hypothetical protein L218DRAFT_964892 [Marasmius fiardii PR-910]|nr:hypothetical protein L218DRAFT_964892 [Marasmius fiardii PR-910]
MPTYRRLQQYALAISVISIIYNGAEGGVSIGLGAESSSRSLVFFGIQSGIEVVSATMVVWRFWRVAKPGEERQAVLSARDLRFERIATTVIAYLLVALALGTEATAVFGLVKHEEPSTSNASLVISASALVLMVLIWLPKRYLARVLNSSAMQGEAKCSLSCIQITIVLFVGALVYRLWKGGWWVDSATSIVLGLMFGWEGWKMWRWARSPDFDGGCCSSCSDRPCNKDIEAASCSGRTMVDTCGTKKDPCGCCSGEGAMVELVEKKKDLCECCSLSELCRAAGECQCSASDASSSKTCCIPVDEGGKKCCSHEYVTLQPPVQTCDAEVKNDNQRSGCLTKDCCVSPTETCDNNPKHDGSKDSCCPTKACNASSRNDSPKDSCCSTKGCCGSPPENSVCSFLGQP